MCYNEANGKWESAETTTGWNIPKKHHKLECDSFDYSRGWEENPVPLNSEGVEIITRYSGDGDFEYVLPKHLEDNI